MATLNISPHMERSELVSCTLNKVCRDATFYVIGYSLSYVGSVSLAS